MAKIFAFFIALIASTAITGIVRKYAYRANLLDVPNQRSSHEVSTPRGGGLGIVIVFLGATLLLYWFDILRVDVLVALFGCGLVLSGVGLMDDQGHVSVFVRAVIQFAVAITAVTILGGLPPIQFGGSLLDLGIFGEVLAVVAIVWLTNLFNFMDGIDGIAATEAVFIASGALIVSAGTGSDAVHLLLGILCAASLGFLYWNWPPAKIFLGDVGSGFLGFVFGVLAIISLKLQIMPLWCWLILAGVFIVDATTTIVARAMRFESLSVPHRTHAYQLAAQLLKGHRPVTVGVILINFVWLLPIAWIVSLRPDFGWWLTLIAWAPLIALVLWLRAGRILGE